MCQVLYLESHTHPIAVPCSGKKRNVFECFPKNYTEFSMCTTPIENPHNNANVFSYTLEKYIEVASFGQAASGTSNICPNITFMWQISPQVQISIKSRLASLHYSIQTESFFWQLPWKEKKTLSPRRQQTFFSYSHFLHLSISTSK